METLTGSAGTHFDPRLVEHFVRILPRILAIKDDWNARDLDESRSA
jgi:putative two-component system response regulator